MMLNAQLETARLRRQLPPPAERRLLRISQGVSLAAIAQECGGVSAVTALRWETGQRQPAGPHLQRYVEVLRRLRAATRRT